MSVYGKANQSELLAFSLLSSGEDNLHFPLIVRVQLCKSCRDGIVPATNRKQLLMISGRVRLPSLPASKETVCLITTRIDRVNATRTNRFTDLVPPPVGPPSKCDFMQVSLHP